MSDQPSAGVHFVVFNPTSDDFERVRDAMDGVFPGGARIDLPPRDRGQGFNSVLQTTHRQNFLVPPRRHRAFPLAESARLGSFTNSALDRHIVGELALSIQGQ